MSFETIEINMAAVSAKRSTSSDSYYCYCYYYLVIHRLVTYLPAPNAKKKLRSGYLFKSSMTLFAIRSFRLTISSVLKYASISRVLCISRSRADEEFEFIVDRRPV